MSSPSLVEIPAPRPPAGRLGRAMRTQAMVLAFYVLDALLMAAYAVHGTLPPFAAVAF